MPIRKRPNKAELIKQAELRGYNTDNEKLMLKGLEVKNVLQKMYNRNFDELVNALDTKKLTSLMETFVTETDKILDKKYSLKSK